MSLLRVCAFAKCLDRRSLLDKCAVRASFADYYQLCLSTRNGAVRRISDKSLILQRRNASYVIPKTEDVKKRVLGQYLVDVLEARIQQLQSDTVVDVGHAKVEFIQAPSSGTGASSLKGPECTLKPDTEANFTSKKEKCFNHQKLQEIPDKTISTTAENTDSLIETDTLFDEIWAPVSSMVTSTTATTLSGEVSKKEKKSIAKLKASIGTKKLAEVEKLEQRLSQQLSNWKPYSMTEDPKASATFVSHQLNIRSYIEACVFIGDIERADKILHALYRRQNQRIYLSADIYNVMMRVYAKKLKFHQVSYLFMMMKKVGVMHNLGSYSAALECMGRDPNSKLQLITRCLNKMEAEGLSLDDLFSQCIFKQDEREMVLKAIHKVQADYQPPGPFLDPNPHLPPLVEDYYTKRAGHVYPKLDLTLEELQNCFRQQLKMEQIGTVIIDSVEASKSISEKTTKMREKLEELKGQWRKTLLQAIRDSKKILAVTSQKSLCFDIYPYICLLDEKEYVQIMIQTLDSLPPTGEALKYLAKEVGTRIYTMYSVQQKNKNGVIEKLNSIYNSYASVLAKDTNEYNILPREHWCNTERQHSSGPTLTGIESQWSAEILLRLGTYTIELMMTHLKIRNDILNPSSEKKLIPILYHMYGFRRTHQIGFIKLHPILLELQQEAMKTKLIFDSYVFPMLCPPIPWTTTKFGAYLLMPAKLIRTPDGATQHDELLDKSKNLYAVMDSLNHLGNCAWMINKPLLDIIISIFNDRGNEELDIPPPMSEAAKIPTISQFDPSWTATEKAQTRKDLANAKNKIKAIYSMRMDTLYKLSIANYVRDEIFWFPHNMDFRGRAYPCSTYLNHIGSDLTRAILLFAGGKPLGPKGLDWLKIHVINLTGTKKKVSLEGRLEYANSIMDDIVDSADNPMNGKKWWMKADEPWQTLACCMEIVKAVRSPDPTQYISHFPVHQDGSCNGLQHYAALGRDVIGATSVNLLPCDMPQDVYSEVAQQIEQIRAHDAQRGLVIAQTLEGLIDRKMVKQTVMTVVYGVTRYGGRLQIERRLKELNYNKDNMWDATHYLVYLVFKGLKEMFTGTRQIQEWLTQTAKFIARSGNSVQWVTPLGLPVIQPYHKVHNHILGCSMQSINVSTTHDIRRAPDKLKQKNAFAPNFIHSLDSTHMMLTSLHCYSAGLTFVSVHDCFWTHADSVDIMNKICREQFVTLHSQPILHDLAKFMLQKYCLNLAPEDKYANYQTYRELMTRLSNVPQNGDLDLNQVKDSMYFFS